MSNLIEKLKGFVGLSETDEYEGEYEYEDEEAGVEAPYQQQYQEPSAQSDLDEQERHLRRRRERNVSVSETGEITTMGNVIGMPGSLNGTTEVMVMEPRSFEEMPQAIQALRERKTLVLNLTMMEPEQAQRAVDFVAGGTYAMDGHQERIGESIFLFTPNCVKVSTQEGILHDVPQTFSRGQRVTAPAPNWSVENARVAQ